jgi:hypothetical protein
MPRPKWSNNGKKPLGKMPWPKWWSHNGEMPFGKTPQPKSHLSNR